MEKSSSIIAHEYRKTITIGHMVLNSRIEISDENLTRSNPITASTPLNKMVNASGSIPS